MCIPLRAISDAINVQLQGNAHVTDYLWRSVVCIPINTAVRYKGYVSKRTKRQLLLNSIQYKQYVTMSGLITTVHCIIKLYCLTPQTEPPFCSLPAKARISVLCIPSVLTRITRKV